MKISFGRIAKWLIPLALLGVSCAVKYTGPGPVGMSVTVPAAGTRGEIKIVRDENYISHIMADSEEDLYFGAGFAMAQDRFSQMDLLRRAAVGTLSEWLGDPFQYKGLSLPAMDVFMRTFRYKENALIGLATMDPKMRRLLEAFTDGVNRYLVEAGDQRIFSYDKNERPAWWNPEDSLAVAELFGLSMTLDCFFEEYYLDRIANKVGPEKLREFMPGYPADAPIITASGAPANAPELIGAMELLRDLLREVIPHPIGSNNWVVAGSRTKSGKALLANDPHVPLFDIPTYWYHCHLKGAGIDVAGMMFPGMPSFGAGTNGHIAWGLTNTMADYIDIYREKVNPKHPNTYQYQGRWEVFRTVKGTVRVKGKKNPIEYSYRTTRHGPVIETGLAGKYEVRNWAPDEVMALRFVDMYLGDVITGYFNLTKAKSWPEFRAACKLIGNGDFGWNMIYADEKGNIGYQTTANIPIRDDNQGVFMHEGWTGDEEWLGYVPFDQLPSAYNPAKGYLLSANNRVEPDGYPYYISDTYLPNRATRINEFLAAHPNATEKDMMALQNDVVDVRARKLVPFILQDLEAADSKKYGDVIEALKKYRENKYESRIDLTGPTVYYLFIKNLPPYILSDELGDELASTISKSQLLMVDNLIDGIFSQPDNAWFDDVRTARREKRSDMTILAMDESIKWMRKRLGRNPAKWTWGNAHKLTLVQPAAAYVWQRIGRKKLVSGPYPYPGSGETVNAASGQFFGRAGYRVVVGPSSRLIVDFSHPDWFNYSASTGMASNPDDPHYTNLTPIWLRGEYVPLYFPEAVFMKGNKGTVVITP